MKPVYIIDAQIPFITNEHHGQSGWGPFHTEKELARAIVKLKLDTELLGDFRKRRGHWRKLLDAARRARVMTAAEAGVDTGGEGKWITSCELHGNFAVSRTKKLAEAADPTEFCDQCRGDT